MLEEKHVQYQGLLNKLVAKEPDDRFQDAAHLIKALKQPTATIDPGPATDATVAVAAFTPGATAMAPPPGAAATPSSQPAATVAPAAGKPVLWKPIAAVVATLLIAVLVFAMMPRGTTTSSGPSGDNLTTEQRIHVQELLQSAATFSKISNYEQAEANLLSVLEDYDCANQEARRGLQALNPGAADFVISNCSK